ncbi:MAG: hypothetical protein KC496_02020, partial [Anaerolineae bacterium]|nr:hypothetical protein [Anaerolineae bacterium]
MLTAQDRYTKITDTIHKLYPAELFTRHGIAHPVTFYDPAPEQVQNVDSVLGREPGINVMQDEMAFYNHAYLQTLQNSGRNLFNGTTFALTTLRQKPLRIEAGFGKYFDMIATCAALDHELLDAVQGKLIRLPMRTQYHRSISPEEALRSGNGRSAALGGVVLTVFNDAGTYRLMLAKRSGTQATRPNNFHMLPAFMFQPAGSIMQAGEWSLRHHILREILEEMFGMEESENTDFYAQPALLDLQQMLDNGEAGLYLTGIAMNLMTLRPEITALLLIQDAEWWPRVTAPDHPTPFMLNEENDGNVL